MAKKLICLIFLLIVLGLTSSVWALPRTTAAGEMAARAETTTPMPKTF